MISQLKEDDVHTLLAGIRSKGVRLWSRDGKIHYRAPKGALTSEELNGLRVSRDRIAALLLGAASTELLESIPQRARSDRAPLAFSQLSMWNLGRSSDGRVMRQIASANRLFGRLNVGALLESTAETVRRHESLRTRIILCSGVPEQEIVPAGDPPPLEFLDLTVIPEQIRDLEAGRRIEDFILEPVDPSVGPLFAARLLRLREEEHVMVVAMAHIISDEASLEILWRDILTGYMQASRRQPFSLPKIHIQFPAYAAFQRDSEHLWHMKHGAYYEKHFDMHEEIRFPVNGSTVSDPGAGRAMVPISIGKDMKRELISWCKSRRTTLVMSVFTAYVALVLRWGNRKEVVVQYQSDARTTHQVANTIGCFTSALYMRIGLYSTESFLDLLQRVTEEYCLAYEHLDFSYHVAKTPRPELTRTTAFNWVPHRPVADDSISPGSEMPKIEVGLQEALNKVWRRVSISNFDPEFCDLDPLMLLYDTNEGVTGGVYFPLERLSVESMEGFGRNFLAFLRALLKTPELAVADIKLQ
jgi:hypothetical protein